MNHCETTFFNTIFHFPLRTIHVDDAVIHYSQPRHGRLIDFINSYLTKTAYEECGVCLSNKQLYELGCCTHSFCVECIKRVIDTKVQCPLCRETLTMAIKKETKQVYRVRGKQYSIQTIHEYPDNNEYILNNDDYY